MVLRTMLLFVQQVKATAGGCPFIITEMGWTDAGFDKNSNFPSPASMAKLLRNFVCFANANNWQNFWFNAYNSDRLCLNI